jgi:ATP-dependent DNA helicase 2 subunit 2
MLIECKTLDCIKLNYLVQVAAAYAGDMMRKSIVFNKKTPDVFYCPQRKPTGFDKMIVQARPLSKLCEHGGNKLPSDYKSDCYNDIDESEYACKEKYRIMVSHLNNPLQFSNLRTIFHLWFISRNGIEKMHCFHS